MSLAHPTPILRLNRDIIREIFEKNDSLDVLRHSSQVCWTWREILLESPSLWGQNVDLDALRQKSDDWRDLVLKRTEQAMLSIGGFQTVRSGTPLFDFVTYMLNKHWTRIRDLKIKVNLKGARWNSIWQTFDRPAPNLQTFSYTDISSIEGRPEDMISSNFQLFSGQAPYLVRLHVDPMFPFTPDIAESRLLEKICAH